MKKVLLLSAATVIAFCCMAFSNVSATDKPVKGKHVEISFDYIKKQGPGSNQYAVWIENNRGEVVKTLFVTSFTTKGRVREGQPIKRGYTYRPACVPTWVTNVKATDMTDAELDAFTGATPKESGKQTFVWDFTDSEGKKVSKGNYKVCVEATLKNEYKLLYVGTLSTNDKAGAIELRETVTGYDEAYAGMIKDVKAIIRK